MQNGTNFAVICNPKTPVELLKLHGHFREKSILTLIRSPLPLQQDLSLPTQFSAKISLLCCNLESPVLSRWCNAQHLCQRVCSWGWVTPAELSAAGTSRTRLFSLSLSLPNPPSILFNSQYAGQQIPILLSLGWCCSCSHTLNAFVVTSQ